MNIRQKITLWIAGTAFMAVVIFTAITYTEMFEQPYRLIDKELHHMADGIIKQGNTGSSWTLQATALPYSPDQYWIKVTDNSGQILYRSPMSRYTKIPTQGKRSRYSQEVIIPRELFQLGQDTHDGVLFRVNIVHGQAGGRPVTVMIAESIEQMEEELLTVLRKGMVGIIACTLFILLVSYWLAGRILRPLVKINKLAREISEKSLDQRIPPGKNRDEIQTLAVSLNRMFDRLQYSFARQKEFIGNASHELKSPITLLRLNLEEMLLNQDLDDSLRNELDRQLNTLRRMGRLVSSLLDLSRLEQHESLTCSSVDLAGLTGQVLDEYCELFPAGGIRLENKLPNSLFMQGDQEKLHRLLINLIDNAARYNLKEGGIIRLTGGESMGMTTITIANTGAPIPDAEVDRVFEQFYRVEKSRSTNHGGSGLGLTIARKIVELHGGRITISSNDTGWTEVTIIVPRQQG
jgi:two-component system OmpR family sensor kinase